MAWREPVFDRTQADVDYAKAQLSRNINEVRLKGCLNSTDLLRIEYNIDHLSKVLTELYYFNTVSDYRIWSKTDIVTVSEVNRIINNVCILWEKYHKPPEAVALPNTLLTFEQVNAIEKNLYLIKEMLDDMIASFGECGTFSCGED